jgi:hypothetical protein
MRNVCLRKVLLLAGHKILLLLLSTLEGILLVDGQGISEWCEA